MIEKFRIYGAFLFMFAFLACDKVDDPFPEGAGNSIDLGDGVEYVIDPELNISTTAELQDFLANNTWDSVIAPDNSTRRFITLEEFTGHECINCSIGTKEVVRLKGILGEQLVPIAIHSGQFAEPRENDTMYTTDHRVEGGHG